MSTTVVESMVPGTLNGTAANSAPVGSGRRKLQLVTKKQARKMLKKLGKRLRGGADEPVVVEAPPPAPKAGGKRTRKGKRSASRRASLFGL